MVAALLVVGEMLDPTGAARRGGDFILKRGKKRNDPAHHQHGQHLPAGMYDEFNCHCGHFYGSSRNYVSPNE